MGPVRDSSPRKGSRNESPGSSVQESKNLPIVETKPPWNWAFWSRAKPTASGPLSPTGGPSSLAKQRRKSPDFSLSSQNSSKKQLSRDNQEPDEKAEALLKPLLNTLGPGAMVEATVYTREIETNIPKDADPKLVEKILEGAFGQFREGKIFPQAIEGPGQLSRRSSEERNQSQDDRLVVRDFAKPDIHFPVGGSEELSKGKEVESSDDKTYRIEESSDNEVPLLELPAWKTTEVRDNNMTVRTHYLSAKGVSKERLIPENKERMKTTQKDSSATKRREDDIDPELVRRRTLKIGRLADKVEDLINRQVDPHPQLRAEIEHDALEELMKGQKIILKVHARTLAENAQVREELHKKQAAIDAYESKLRAIQADSLRLQEETEKVETYKQEVEHQKTLRLEMEKQIALLSAPTPALDQIAKQSAMLLKRLQDERVRRSKAEGKVRSLNRQINKLAANSDSKAVGGSDRAPEDVPHLPSAVDADDAENDPSTSGTVKDDFDEYNLVIDNYLFSPTKREEWMEKEGIILKGQDGTFDMNKVVKLVDSYHTLQKRYTDLQNRFKQQDMEPAQSAPSGSDVLSVRALNQKCEALLHEVDGLRKSREAMEAHIEKLKQIHPSGDEAPSSSESMLENTLRHEESRRVADETKIQMLSEKVQDLQLRNAGYQGRSELLPLQEKALNIGVFAMAQLIMLSYGFGAWLEMMLIPLFGRFPT